MKILVSIKRVADPDNASKLKVSGDGTAVTSEGLEWKMNPFDDWSLEAALRLTENAAEKNARVGEVVLEASISCATCWMRSLLSAMLLSRLVELVALGPVVFYMLQELAVPGSMGLVAVAPVNDEFR